MRDDKGKKAVPWRIIIAATIVVLAILVPFFIFGDAIEEWTENFIDERSGHRLAIALVLGSLLVGDIVLPVPSSLISTACGRYLGFALGTVVSFVSMTLAAVIGYLLGFWASRWARRLLNAEELATLDELHGRWGIWALAAVRPVPVLAEASVVFAGLSRLSWRHGLPLVLVGNLAVSAVYAAIGALAQGRGATIWAFAGAAALSGLAMLLAHRRKAS